MKTERFDTISRSNEIRVVAIKAPLPGYHYLRADEHKHGYHPGDYIYLARNLPAEEDYFVDKDDAKWYFYKIRPIPESTQTRINEALDSFEYMDPETGKNMTHFSFIQKYGEPISRILGVKRERAHRTGEVKINRVCICRYKLSESMATFISVVPSIYWTHLRVPIEKDHQNLL